MINLISNLIFSLGIDSRMSQNSESLTISFMEHEKSRANSDDTDSEWNIDIIYLLNIYIRYWEHQIIYNSKINDKKINIFKLSIWNHHDDGENSI